MQLALPGAQQVQLLSSAQSVLTLGHVSGIRANAASLASPVSDPSWPLSSDVCLQDVLKSTGMTHMTGVEASRMTGVVYRHQSSGTDSRVRVHETSKRSVPAKQATPVEQRADLLARVNSVVTAVVGSDVQPDDVIMDFGLDSLDANDLTARLSGAIGLDGTFLLPAAVLYDYPSVATLMGFLETLWVPAPTATVVGGTDEDDYSFSGLDRVPNSVVAPLRAEAPLLHTQIVDTMAAVLAYDPKSEEELIVDGETNPDEASVLLHQLAHLSGMKLAMIPMSISSSYPTAAALSQFLASSASVVEFDSEHTDWDSAVFKGKREAIPQPKSGNERFASESSWTRELLHGLVCDAVRDISGIAGLDSSESLNDRILNETHTTRLRFELAHLVGVVMLPPVFTTEYPSIDSVVDYLLSLIQGGQE